MSVTYEVTDDRRQGSMGTAIPPVESKVVDLSSGENLGPNEEGELLLRGDSIVTGYWEAPERNERAFTDG